MSKTRVFSLFQTFFLSINLSLKLKVKLTICNNAIKVSSNIRATVSSMVCKSPSPTPRVKSISVLKKKKKDLEKNYYFSST